jgi:glyoxylase-like metal-dependent hydrolase (beta-lactamase superfamily II)
LKGEKKDIPYTLYNGITPNPTVQQADVAARQALDFGANAVIAIGGASPIDACQTLAEVLSPIVPGLAGIPKETEKACAGIENWLSEMGIDLGLSPEEIQYLVLTHSHFDHICGVPGLLKAFPKIIYTPGHSLGSVSVLLNTGDAFVGDLAMSAFPACLSPGLTIFADDFQKLKKSCQVLIDKGAKRIYPAHGKPFSIDVIKKAI